MSKITHFLSDNPYWDIVSKIPGDHIQTKYYHQWAPEGRGHNRTHLCNRYSWAIPDPLTLNTVSEYLGPQAVEIGAGLGYWAWQLAQLGISIDAYDLHPFPEQNGYTEPGHPGYRTVKKGGPEVLKQYPSTVSLFLCWPPREGSMGYDCLTHFKGKRLVYIGEAEGGCTGDDGFFGLLQCDWKLVATHKPIQWSGIHDCVYVYDRLVTRG